MEKKISYLTTMVISMIAVFGCDKKSDSTTGTTPATTYTYNSTTTKGDMVSWSITGTSASAVWRATNSSGAIDFTYNIAATCSAEDTNYKFRECTINSTTCTAGASACPGTLPSGVFHMLEVPNTAILVSKDNELHTGFISGGCPADVSGDYTFVRTGYARITGSNGKDMYGMYRTDTSFNSVIHSDFGFGFGATTAMNDAVASYTTGTASETLVGTSCTDGIFSRTISGNTLRANLTSSGLFILDLPSGSGGLVSFKSSLAATVTDLQNKSWVGVSFGDTPTSGERLIKATTAAAVGNAITFNATINDHGTETSNTAVLTAASDASLNTIFATPGSYSALGHALKVAYPTVQQIPGLFRMVAGGDSSRIVAVAAKLNGTVFMFGTVYNARGTLDTTPADGIRDSCTPASTADANCVPRIAGNFFLFSK